MRRLFLSSKVRAMRAFILGHPEVWGDASAPIAAERIDAVVADIVSGRRVLRVPPARTRRRRLFTGGAIGLVVLTGGVAGVTAVLRLAQPSRPEQPVGCYESIEPGASVVALPLGVDPIVACRDAWISGPFPASTTGESGAPSLVACISELGAVSVYPGDESTCGVLGLVAADPVPDVYVAAIMELQQRIVDEVNLAGCGPAPEIAEKAAAILAATGPSGWRVEIRPDSVNTECAIVVVIAEQRLVQVIKMGAR